ncbi:MAG: transketolase family protein [Candidatus Omnitrophota bacterium]|nr:transketolase family protein [Candidatus Omnitrophota bacterium]
MDKVVMKPTRDGFGEGLVELGEKRKDIVALCADLTESTRVSWFKKKFPDRFFSMGVSEQDMIGTAAGFALAGKTPFAATFGVFAAGRAWDQVRVSVAYMNLNVKIAGTHGGISVGPDGPTHQAIEEITLMRVLPNMTVIVPCDWIEAKKATIASASYKGPVYLRLGRGKEPTITKEQDLFEIGKANVLRKGNDVAIIACGHEVHEALLAHDTLKKKGISARVINLHTIKPLDRDVILSAARETGAIVTAEEHSLSGGMGSAVSELVSQECPVPIKFVGVKDRFGESGEPKELFKVFELTEEYIVKAAEEVVRRKKNKKS